MKKTVIIIVSCVLAIALLAGVSIFFSHDTQKMEDLFDQTIKALDTKDGLENLFMADVTESSKTFDEDIKKIKGFYQGKTIEIKDKKLYRESATIYRGYCTAVTDKGEYFVCVGLSGARRIDSYGIKQLIVEDSKSFKKRNLFKRDKFDTYIAHSNEFGPTVRVEGD